MMRPLIRRMRIDEHKQRGLVIVKVRSSATVYVQFSHGVAVQAVY